LFRAVSQLSGFVRLTLIALILGLGFAPSAAQSVDTSLIALSDCWKIPLNSAAVSSPVADKNQLYLAQEGGRVSAVSLVSGTRLWSAEIGGEIGSNIVPDGKNIYLVSNIAGKRSVLRSVSTISGVPNLETEIPYSDNLRIGISYGRLIVIYPNGTVAAYEFGSGKPAWQMTLPPINTATAVFNEQSIIVPTDDKKIQVITAADGKILLTVPTRGTVTTVGMVEEDLVWGEDRGNLVRFDTEEKSLSWKYKNGARIGAVRSTERGILAASYDNFVYLLSGYNGDIRWKKRLPGRTAGMTVVGDTAVVLTIGDPTAVLISLETGKQVGQVTTTEDDLFTFPPVVTGDQMIFFSSAQVVAKSTKVCRTN
jgi:outer membrane protein assembly factor BamB